MPDTHEVRNQAPPLTRYNVFLDDPALVEATRRHTPERAWDELATLGRIAGSPRAQEWGESANRYPPELRTHDRYGHRVDEVYFHPSYHNLMRMAVRSGIAGGGVWDDPKPGGHVARAAAMIIWSQVDAGHICPVSMTYAAVPALRVDPALAAFWEPRLTSRTYDFGLRPVTAKNGALAGMAMTEKQGGSDVRANLTTAIPLAEDGTYALTGHKWFCSAPMNDVFLVLAQAPGGLTCFIVPRVLPDGSRNTFRLQRLKDKLGNRSNASGEVEFDGTVGWRLGDEGRGVNTIVEMVAVTRLDCVLGTAAGMRLGTAAALHHAANRQAFGRTVIDHPLARNVLADLAVESEAATLLGIRLAATLDPPGPGATADPASERALRRIGTALAKYHVCKRGPIHAAEALECLGGNGYVEESGMPRLFRESPLNSVWEGTGNVNALDVLRAMAREPGCVEVFTAEIEAATGADRRFDAAARTLGEEMARADEVGARRLVERMALVLQASLLVRHGHPAVADAFCASRLDGDWGHAYGTLPSGADLSAIVERARPKTA